MQVRSSRQNYKLEQWVMDRARAVKDEVQGSIFGTKKKVFLLVYFFLLYRLSIPMCYMTNQLTIKGTIPFNKA